MRSEDRRDAATATVGAGALATGGVVRHAAVQSMLKDGKKPGLNHAVAVARRGSKLQRRTFLGGSALGLAGLAPFAVGTSRLATGRDVSKAEERSFLSEGLRGSASALKERGKGALAPVPRDVRAAQLGIGVGAGLAGSGVARALLPKALRPVAGPLAGAAAATASVPLTNRVIADRGYQATATGVKRTKTAAKKPSSRAQVVDSRRGPTRMQIVPSDQRFAKADSYLGSRTSYGQQRAAITAAGGVPLVGPLTGAKAAAAYAPPGQERKQAVRHWAMGSGAGLAAGAAGAYGGGRLTERNDRALRASQSVLDAKDKVETRARTAVGAGPKRPAPVGSLRSRALTRAKATSAAKPFLTPRGAVGGAAGFLGAKAATGLVGGQTAISLNQRDQRRYNAKHGISKAGAPGTKQERESLAGKKRASAVLSGAGGVAGLTGLALLRRNKSAATTAGIIGGGFGGANALLNVPIQRNEAKAIDPVKKRLRARTRAVNLSRARAVSPDTPTGRRTADALWAGSKNEQLDRALQLNRGSVAKAVDIPKHALISMKFPRTGSGARAMPGGKMRGMQQVEVTPYGQPGPTLRYPRGAYTPMTNRSVTSQYKLQVRDGKGSTRLKVRSQPGMTTAVEDPRLGRRIVGKRDSLEIKHKAEHPTLLRQYGDKGPLPKGLDRPTKMKAYEARYVAHGGDRADKYGRRADAAEGVRNAGVAGATVGGAAWLAARGKKTGPKIARKVNPRAKHHADTAAVGAATVGGAAELYGEYARGRRASYTNSPAGVAGSALRRMRDYTPD